MPYLIIMNRPTGFDFEKQKGLPVLLFRSNTDRNKCWIAHKEVQVSIGSERITVTLARVQLRRKKVSKGDIVMPKWPTKTQLMEELQGLVSDGVIPIGEPLESESTRDVLLPGGVVLPGEQLLQLHDSLTSVSDDEVCVHPFLSFVCSFFIVCMLLFYHLYASFLSFVYILFYRLYDPFLSFIYFCFIICIHPFLSFVYILFYHTHSLELV